MLPGIISIDGSIGAGKTTVMTTLQRLLTEAGSGADPRWPTTLDLEPVELWEPYLARVYNEASGWFRLQMRIIRDRLWPPAHSWIERSLFFQERVFVRSAVADGRISEDDVTMIDDLYSLAHSRWNPEIYVYLRSSPEGCYRRMRSRARKSETAVPLSYLEMLHTKHEAALAELRQQAPGACILEIDVEGKTPEEVAREILLRIARVTGWRLPAALRSTPKQ